MNSTKSKAPRERSPGFPFISLKIAIQRLEQFSEKFGRHPTPANKAGLAWDLKPGSSQAAQTLAALKSFGLLDYEGTGASRMAVITPEGRNFLRAQQEHVKLSFIKDAAMKPKNIRMFWDKWGPDRPIDEVCLDELVLNYKFNEKSAPTFLRVYDETIAYAGLSDSDKIHHIDEDEDGFDDNPEDDSHDDPPRVDQRHRNKPEVGMKEDVFTLDEGTAVFKWPATLSRDSFDDMKSWIEIVLRKAERTIEDDSADHPDAD